MLKLNAFFEIVKLFLNIRLGGRECKYADQTTLFVSPNHQPNSLKYYPLLKYYPPSESENEVESLKSQSCGKYY
mgnify:CR=1 FL=1